MRCHFRDGHLFVELNDGLWLFDTGAPSSFGKSSRVAIAGERFDIQLSYLGLTAESLSEYVEVDCAGLLGADVLGRFDHLLDVTGGKWHASTSELPHGGDNISLTELMGIPILSARIAATEHRMFFDTGAQLSYLQCGSLSNFPAAGVVTDFYPGVGRFGTETHSVPLTIGETPFTLRFGKLPSELALSLMVGNVAGIVGNEVLAERTIGYFPRRKLLAL